jgi:hypothetical protein
MSNTESLISHAIHGATKDLTQLAFCSEDEAAQAYLNAIQVLETNLALNQIYVNLGEK